MKTPSIGTKLRLKEPVVSKYATITALEWRVYDAARNITALLAHDELSERSKITLSVNLDLAPSLHHFWLKNWSEHKHLAGAMVEAGVIVLTGRTECSGYVTVPEGYVNFNKLEDSTDVAHDKVVQG